MQSQSAEGGGFDAIDKILIRRQTSVPTSLLTEDFVLPGGGGPTGKKELSHRLCGNTWIAPWGATTPFLLPPTAKEDNRVTLSIPQSKVRHFLTDASLFIISSNKPRIQKAVLKIGDKIIQNLDSEFACEISLVYKRGIRLEDSVKYCNKEKSWCLATPLMIESPLLAIPLTIPNTPLPKITYELSPQAEKNEDVKFATEFVSSSGESIINAGEVTQCFPSFTTFSSSDKLSFPTPSSYTVVVNMPMTKASLIRCLYVRLRNDTQSDIDNIITAIDVFYTDDKNVKVSLLGFPYPGSLCRTHYKSKFGFATGDKAARLPYTELPFYVVPFAVSPASHNPDFGELGGRKEMCVHVTLTDIVGENFVVDVAAETQLSVTW